MTTNLRDMRPHGGRKPKNNGILYARMPKDTIMYIREYARLNHMSVAQYIETLINRS